MTTIATTVTTQRPDFGALVRTWRQRAGLTRYVLAVRCCWEPDARQVAAIEQSEPIQLEEHHALVLMAALGIPPEELARLGLLGTAEAALLRLLGSVGLTITDPDTGEVSVPLTVDQLAELAGLAVELAAVARSLRPGSVPDLPERPGGGKCGRASIQGRPSSQGRRRWCGAGSGGCWRWCAAAIIGQSPRPRFTGCHQSQATATATARSAANAATGCSESAHA
jgi:hypothetical protein